MLLLASVAGLLAAQPAAAQAPPVVYQVGTRGCIEVGVRPAAPFSQPLPLFVPAGYDILSRGYPPYGYDSTGFTPTTGTNSCLYGFYDSPASPPKVANLVVQGYCVQWAAGQLSGTRYDPQPTVGADAPTDDGYVRYVVSHYWPATNEPATLTATAQKAGVVAMAIHFLTDGVVLAPNFTLRASPADPTRDLAVYNAVRAIVAAALAAGPEPVPADPTPVVDGPDAGPVGSLVGPYTVGANVLGAVTVAVTGAAAFLDAAGTVPFPGGELPPGGQLWLRADVAGSATIDATGRVRAPSGTLMVGSPPPGRTVQEMMLPQPVELTGHRSHPVEFAPAAALFSRTSAHSGDAIAEVVAGHRVADDVAVVHAPPGGATLLARLIGPAPPEPAGGCSTVDWSEPALPVRPFTAVAVTRDGDYPTPDVTLELPGCYTFAAVLQPASGPPVLLPPGDSTETLLVLPRLVPPPVQVRTQASADVIPSGGTVSDRVLVSGLLPGRTATVTPVLFGPVPPGPGQRCADLDWVDSSPPVTARFPARTVADGGFDTPPVQLTLPGCYAFVMVVTHDQVTGGETPVEHGLGQSVELILVLPGAPAPPAPPATALPATALPVTGGPAGALLAAGALALLCGAACLVAAGRLATPTTARFTGRPAG